MIAEAISRADDELLRRWPDASLTATFRGFLTVYGTLCAPRPAGAGERTALDGFELLCDSVSAALLPGRAGTSAVRPPAPEQVWLRSLALSLRERHKSDWLQRLASILAMLMHFALDARVDSLLVNHRRPGKRWPTYPTSPAAARLVADTLIFLLGEHEVPAICHGAREAERYAERALAFRILDPSLESGQLLLEVAQAILRPVFRRHPAGTREARFLCRALLEKLCSDCLWGIDRNELAVPAFKLLMSLLAGEHGVACVVPQHLLTADALDVVAGERLPEFDGVVNNPPWGEELGADERTRLRSRFRALHHHTDTYVSFSEMAIRSLRPGGAFAMILPSHAMSARNASGLRELLLGLTCLERLVLLPRAAFGDATVRGLVLAGRARPVVCSSACRATIYPLVKRMAGTGPPRTFAIPRAAFARLGRSPWSSLLAGADLTSGWGPTVPLGSLAIVASGVQLYGEGKGYPPQTPEVVRLRPFSFSAPGGGTTPAIRGRDVRPFQVLDPKQYVRFGRWLARVGAHQAYRRESRIFVRELCRRDGRLSAAPARDGFVPLHGVLTVLPGRIDPRILVGILNSGSAAAYVRAHAASFSKVDFQRITVEELRQMPVPAAALDAATRIEFGLGSPSMRHLALRNELVEIVEGLACEDSRDPGAAGSLDRLEAVVAGLFRQRARATG